MYNYDEDFEHDTLSDDAPASIRVLDGLCQHYLGATLKRAKDDQSGCYFGPGRGNNWMSPAKIVEMMIEAQAVSASVDEDEFNDGIRRMHNGEFWATEDEDAEV